jgi:prevent-host-death family protein
MCYMMTGAQVGVRELRQNLSVYLERIARGETLEVTDRGRAVAILAPIRHESSALERLTAAGLVVPAKGDLLDLPKPRRAPAGFSATRALAAQRADRRL